MVFIFKVIFIFFVFAFLVIFTWRHWVISKLRTSILCWQSCAQDRLVFDQLSTCYVIKVDWKVADTVGMPCPSLLLILHFCDLFLKNRHDEFFVGVVSRFALKKVLRNFLCQKFVQSIIIRIMCYYVSNTAIWG